MPRRNPKEQRNYLARPQRMTPKQHRRFTETSHAGYQQALNHQRQLTSVRRVPRNQLVTGVVVLARVAFTEDPTRHKVRPAIVVAVNGRDVTLLPLFTHRGNPNRAATVLTPGPGRGLRCISEVRSGPVVVDLLDVIALQGRLDPRGPELRQLIGPTSPQARNPQDLVGSRQ